MSDKNPIILSGQPGEMFGQLGHGDKASYRTPKQVDALQGCGVVDVVAGDDFTIAILDDEQLVRAWLGLLL